MVDELLFDNVDGPWAGNDYDAVSVTSVSFPGKAVGVVAFVFMTRMNIDFDGAPTAYGPEEKDTLDSLEDAGRNSSYYGLIAVDPTEIDETDTQKPKRLIKDRYNLVLDPRYPDKHGQCPVVQQAGDSAPGYFVSTTPVARGSKYKQSSYLDSSKVPYGALSYRLRSKGVQMGDYGLAIRHDTGRCAGFNFLEGGHGEGSDTGLKPGQKTLEGALGECSYKVFLDIGGKPKTRAQKYPDNNFPTSFIIFPNSQSSQLPLLATASNADDLPRLIAYYMDADDAAGEGRTGYSGKPLLDEYISRGRNGEPPRTYFVILSALRAAGYGI